MCSHMSSGLGIAVTAIRIFSVMGRVFMMAMLRQGLDETLLWWSYRYYYISYCKVCMKTEKFGRKLGLNLFLSNRKSCLIQCHL